MDLKEGKARIEAGEAGMDPREIPEAIRKAGFTAKDIEVVAIGEVALSDRGPILRLSGPLAEIALVGDGLDSLEAGARMRILGRIEPLEDGEEGFRLRVLELRAVDGG